jgi:uncharacterized alpha-E superfamily protein
MPGGFVRIADDNDPHAISLQRGGQTADAWVISDGPAGETTLLPTPERIAIKRATGMLPSRAADNLFWVGRYVERAEATLRLVRALVNRIIDADQAGTEVVERITDLLESWSVGPRDIPDVKATLIARAALQGSDANGSLPCLVSAARSAASVIRDRLSPDAWRALTSLVATVHEPLPAGPVESVMVERVNAALRIISSLSGLVQENMVQLGGWRFLELGRRIERALATCRFVRQFAAIPAEDDALEVLLELCDSQITYRQRYVMIAARAPVVDLAVLDPGNPRSVAYQIERLEEHLAALPGRGSNGRLSPLQQIVTPIATALCTADAGRVDDELLLRVEGGLLSLSDAIAASHVSHNERPEVEWDSQA